MYLRGMEFKHPELLAKGCHPCYRCWKPRKTASFGDSQKEYERAIGGFAGYYCARIVLFEVSGTWVLGRYGKGRFAY